MVEFLMSYLPALLVTMCVESLLALLLAPPGTRRRSVLACAALNLLTHPLGTLVMLHANAPFSLLEATIAAVEYLGYRKLVGMRPGRALTLAVTANALTAALSFYLA